MDRAENAIDLPKVDDHEGNRLPESGLTRSTVESAIDGALYTDNTAPIGNPDWRHTVFDSAKIGLRHTTGPSRLVIT